MTVKQTDDKITRLGNAGIERFACFGQSSDPASAVYVNENGRFQRFVAVFALVYVEIQPLVVGRVLHETGCLYVHGTLGVENGEKTEELVFGVTAFYVREFQVVDQFFVEFAYFTFEFFFFVLVHNLILLSVGKFTNTSLKISSNRVKKG